MKRWETHIELKAKQLAFNFQHVTPNRLLMLAASFKSILLQPTHPLISGVMIGKVNVSPSWSTKLDVAVVAVAFDNDFRAHLLELVKHLSFFRRPVAVNLLPFHHAELGSFGACCKHRVRVAVRNVET